MIRYVQKSRRGFSLIEMVIVLGVIGIAAAGLWRLMASSSQSTKDQATAQQQSSLITAASAYLEDITPGSGQDWLKGIDGTAGVAQTLPLPTSNGSLSDCQAHITAANKPFCNFLPPGFTNGTVNPYGQAYEIHVLKDAASAAGVIAQSFSFLIVTSGGAVIPDTEGGRISGLIGSDGGFIYGSPVCAIAGVSFPACGSLGSWKTDIHTYGFATATAGGYIASRSYVVGSAFDVNDFWLARVMMSGDSSTWHYNTMHADLIMGDWQGSITTPLSGGHLATPDATVSDPLTPAIHLQNAIIDGEGVGTTATTSQLSLVVPTGAPAAQFITNNVPLVVFSGGCTSNAISTGTATYAAGCPSTLSVNGDITSAGILYQSRNVSTSDARLKTDIHPIKDPLSNLMKVDAVSFKFKGAVEQKSMGVTAQNLEKTYPELVTEHEGIKYVEYNGLIGPLIGAVQELKQQNDALREELRQQKLREDRLENKLNSN